MSEAVTDIIVARSRQADGLGSTVAWSLAAHAVLMTLVIILGSGGVSTPPPEVMTISLGGAPGPRTGGQTQMGGRTVQEVTPPDATPPRAQPAPAPARPEMTVPEPRAPRPPRTRPEQAPPEASSRTPTTGPEPNEGLARSDTRVRGQGFGLSQGGGLGGGVQLDVTNFCCQEYLEQMIVRIQRNWQQNQGVGGATVMQFTILRDGTIDMVEVERPSGLYALDNAAMRALVLTRQLPPLPARFPNPTLTVHLTFRYER